MKKCSVLILLMLGIACAACNTIKGVGKDIEKGGEAIQRSAN